MKKNIKKHISEIHKRKTYDCNMCPSKFSQRGGLKKHIEEFHHKKRYECKICEKKVYEKF